MHLFKKHHLRGVKQFPITTSKYLHDEFWRTTNCVNSHTNKIN